MRVASHVVMPLNPSPLDLRAQRHTLEVLLRNRGAGQRAAFVLNMVHADDEYADIQRMVKNLLGYAGLPILFGMSKVDFDDLNQTDLTAFETGFPQPKSAQEILGLIAAIRLLPPDKTPDLEAFKRALR
jgi:hypothetical protein